MLDLDLIKKMHDMTGLPYPECKRFIEEANGDVQKAKRLAKDYLQEKNRGTTWVVPDWLNT